MNLNIIRFSATTFLGPNNRTSSAPCSQALSLCVPSTNVTHPSSQPLKKKKQVNYGAAYLIFTGLSVVAEVVAAGAAILGQNSTAEIYFTPDGNLE
jgi:hypothetical protein